VAQLQHPPLPGQWALLLLLHHLPLGAVATRPLLVLLVLLAVVVMQLAAVCCLAMLRWMRLPRQAPHQLHPG
jgi:hypothetical protein